MGWTMHWTSMLLSLHYLTALRSNTLQLSLVLLLLQRNYPYFFTFVLSSTLLCLFIFAMCALHIKMLMDGDPPLTVWKALQKSPASAFLMAYAFLATWFVGGLTVFHLYLMSTNQVTFLSYHMIFSSPPLAILIWCRES